MNQDVKSISDQDLLQTFRREARKRIWNWQGSPNEWCTNLSKKELGEIGELFIAKKLGAIRLNNHLDSEVDLVCGDRRIEVKTACVSDSANPNGTQYELFSWQHIRLEDEFTHLCLVLVYPDRIRCFLLERALVEKHSTQSGRRGRHESVRQITQRRIPEWLRAGELTT